MGKNSGGSRTVSIGVGTKSGIGATHEANIKDLSKIKDPVLRKEVIAAVEEFSKEIGIKSINIKVADTNGSEYAYTTFKGGKLVGITLNSKYFNDSKVLIKAKGGDMASGWSTKTSKVMRHTMIHELGHATWSTLLSEAKYKAAGKEIRKMYRAWQKDTKKTGYGTYSTKNVDEFWAETVAKSFYGKHDKYTTNARAIIRKYNLGK
ncbi:MAG: hypothetical protein J5630_00825 [Bacteroidaceae bacterium]|nr:hypothetical protein [Bacteroidaceae bacterium]